MAETDTKPCAVPNVNSLVEQLRRARQWAWEVHDNRVPGVARDLAWALIAMTRDHDPDTYSPWSRAGALEPERLFQALTLSGDIARLIRKADALQPHLVRSGRVSQ